MATTINYADIQNYLNAIADLSGVIAGSPHKIFWDIPYGSFISTNVPRAKCNGNPVLIMNNNKVDPALDPLMSPFYRILIDPAGFCGNPQMPDGGPMITEAGYSVNLPDGSVITGAQIQTNIESWLSNGFPEFAPAIV